MSSSKGLRVFSCYSTLTFFALDLPSLVCSRDVSAPDRVKRCTDPLHASPAMYHSEHVSVSDAFDGNEDENEIQVLLGSVAGKPVKP